MMTHKFMTEKKGKAIAWLVGIRGDGAWVAPGNGKKFSLKELQGFVGGNIEIVRAKEEGMILVINEEGKINNLPVNPSATKLYVYGSLEPLAWERGVGDTIHGDVVLVNERFLN